jgi:phospholipid-transporting ATPase
MITFLPKNLAEQFQKLANVYFVIIAILQSIPDISNSGGVPNILLPLGLVLTISGIKDLLEDRKRKKSDEEENNRKTFIRKNGSWDEIKWKELQIGDLCRVEKDDKFPADLVVLRTSDEKGICYIETKNLDGETNLKHKMAAKATQTYYVDDSMFDGFSADIKCEDPNPMIYQFQGILRTPKGAVPLSTEQFLLRGSSLKNTDWIVGIVVYTGHETKIMLNSSKSKAKMSSNEKQMNNQIIYLFFLQLVLCGFCAVFNVSWMASSIDEATYLELKRANTDTFYLFVVNFFSWMLLFSNFVPISLLVTLEMVKFIQAIFISWDLDIYFEETDMPAGVQSSNLNEELGQIHYLFSDKTGTLTCNVMEFKKLTVKGKTFGTDQRCSPDKKIPYVDFVDSSFNPRSPEASDFLMHLACCHTILTECKDGVIEYKASSPDELALVNAAKFFGYEFIGRDGDQRIELKVHGQTVKVALLNIIEFNSDRKRMTVVVRMHDGRIKVFCKGADTIIQPRLVPDPTIDPTFEHLENYGKIGLRTLLIASRDLTESQYEQWNQTFVDAMNDIVNRDKRISECGETIEREMTLLGATAIEDRLQDGVPDTIKFLREAGIKVWVLTGDKIETAVNIGFSCNLLTTEMEQVYVTSIKTRDVEDDVNKAFETVKHLGKKTAALIVSGESLLKIKDNLQQTFVQACDRCRVVLACRVSPQQKADIVKMIRDAKPEAKTLSIGDGANDVNMITMAHVGVGIAGLEGKQAVRASDYSIAQFSFLKKLLFVHGRECYRRNSTLICFNFYKNVLLVMPLFFYGMFSVFSGQIFYNTWVYQLFNLLFASLPIVVYAVLDREMDKSELMSDPKHYILGLKGLLFSTQKFWQWIFEACIQAMIILVISLFALCYTTGRKHYGQMDPMSVAAVMVFGMVVVYVNLKVFLFSYSHSILSISLILFSILFYYFISALITEWFPISDTLDNFDSYKATYMMFSNPNSYIAFLVLVFTGFFLQPLIIFYYIAVKRLFGNRDRSFVGKSQEIGLATSINVETIDDPSIEEPVQVVQRNIRRSK